MVDKKVIEYEDRAACRMPSVYTKVHPDAQNIETSETDYSFSVTLIDRTEMRTDDITHDINEFSTGLLCLPPPGFYFEVTAERDLYKSGYMLPNSFQVDPGQELVVPLFKFKDVPDIELPFTGISLTLRKRYDSCLNAERAVSAPQPVVQPVVQIPQHYQRTRPVPVKRNNFA